MRPIAYLHIVPNSVAHVKTNFTFFLRNFLAVSFRGNCGGFGVKTRHIAPSLPIYLGAKELAWLWTGMVAVSLIFGALTGNLNALSAAALEGARSAVELCLAMCGVMCLWTGVMEVMNQCHLTDRLASLFRPLLKRLLPNASRDSETLAAISANLSADLLGLGNAATPLGIRAACRMSRGCKGTASDELCLLVVLNTASIQLLPTTLAGVRASLGAADPFDILPAVWLTSLLSVLAGLFAAKLFAHFWRN